MTKCNGARTKGSRTRKDDGSEEVSDNDNAFTDNTENINISLKLYTHWDHK